MDLSLTTLSGGAILTGIMVACWDKIKMVLSKVYGLFIVSAHVDERMIHAIEYVIWKEYKPIFATLFNFSGRRLYVKSSVRPIYIAFENLATEPMLYHKGRSFIFVNAMKDQYGESRGASISCLRGTMNLRSFVEYCTDEFNKGISRKFSRFQIFRKVGSESSGGNGRPTPYNNEHAGNSAGVDWNDSDCFLSHRPLGVTLEDIGYPYIAGALSYLALPDIMNDAFKEAQYWKENEDWFKQRNIPWKRGWLLCGPAGSGKTSYARAVAQELNLPVFAIDLGTISNQDLFEHWAEATAKSPSIILLEDIDGVFKGRKNINNKMRANNLTFDCLLNCIDGIDRADGIFVIITTNHPETLDPAIAKVDEHTIIPSRPGRIDRVLVFDVLDREGRIKIAKRIFAGYPEAEWMPLVDLHTNVYGAQFQEICTQTVMKKFWGKTIS